MSIMHRITGVAWSVGTLLLVWWLWRRDRRGELRRAQWFMGSILGLLALFGLTVAAWYHTLAGVRHILWDWGFGFELPMMYRTGRAVLVGTAVLTVLTWLLAIVFWR
jgi:succinate dehydrogenase / fumarate reductase cytochrome b subunit